MQLQMNNGLISDVFLCCSRVADKSFVMLHCLKLELLHVVLATKFLLELLDQIHLLIIMAKIMVLRRW